MASLLESMADPAVVGFDAGWQIEFRCAGPDGNPIDQGAITISRDDYFATISVERTTSFRAPTFDVVIEGLSDADHASIVGGPYVFAKIALGWRDLGSGGLAPFKDVGALLSGGGSGDYHEVIHGRIHTYERLHGDFRYRTHISGIDLNFHRLRNTAATAPPVQPGSPAIYYARHYAGNAGVPVKPHPPQPPYDGIDEVIETPPDAKVHNALRNLATQAHGGGVGRQIPMFVATDGLHFGPWAAPSTGSQLEAKQIEAKTGLVETTPVLQDDSGDPENPIAAPSVLRYDVLMRGRADIDIGHKVELEAEEPDPGSLTSTTASSVLGGIGDVAVGIAQSFGASVEPDFSTFRVVSVKHSLDRAKGLVTKLRVERQTDGEPVESTESATTAEARALDEAARTAIALAAQSRSERAEVIHLDVGKVAAQSVEFSTEGDRAFDGQRLDVHEGLDRTAQRNASVRAELAEAPTVLFNKPYLTPYAFGSTGLVIPHYPGTRVVDLHYREQIGNTIVAGCLWNESAEPRSELGDYWLSLPVDFSPAERDDNPRAASTPSGPAVHDLIDGHGGRAIHARGLTIKVGEGLLVDVGNRPESAAEDEVLIEHKSGASIHIDSEGNISISTSKDITFDANKITMNVADSVEVVK
ncbi:hypothetical protein [Ilumatobacter sp.]|uniref:hypothetical protein n=1 Tax=Ilumatobacter sp. TaxID=1967498 RepID=UPI003B51BB51